MKIIKNWQSLPYHWFLPLAFFCLGLINLYASPNFEASDTDEHIGMIKWIAEQGALPVQSPDHDELFGQEASQPATTILRRNGSDLASDGHIGF